MCQFPWCKDSQWQISSCPHGTAEYRTRKKTGNMSSWIQYKSAPGPTESEAVPMGMTNEQVYKLQGEGEGFVCVCVFFQKHETEFRKVTQGTKSYFQSITERKKYMNTHTRPFSQLTKHPFIQY